jgi:hypothetical protein
MASFPSKPQTWVRRCWRKLSPCRQATFGTYLSHHRDNALTLAAARAANRELIERFEKKIELPLDRIRGEEEPVGLDAVA